MHGGLLGSVETVMRRGQRSHAMLSHITAWSASFMKLSASRHRHETQRPTG